MRPISLTTLVAASVGLGLATAAAAEPAYLALGDSITFGETDLQYVRAAGDRGYVGDYADIIGDRTGTRPNVINLAIDGETAASFMSGNGRTPPVAGRTDVPLAQENTSYDPDDLVPQGTLLESTVAAQKAAGNSINTVSLTLGFNELGALATLPDDQGLDQTESTLDSYKSNYEQVLSQIRGLLPDANLFLLGYYNPFPADPDSPAAPIFNKAGGQLNDIIKNEADNFDAFYVNNAEPFVGNEAEYTFLDDLPAGSSVSDPFGGTLPIGNVHPNATGYSVIAQQLEAARTAGSPVPEPSGFAVFGAGLVLLAGSLWRRRQHAAPRPSAA